MSLATTADAAPKLSVRLQDGTKLAHRAVERHAFLRAIVQGSLDRETYRLYLRDLLWVYCALEAALDAHTEHPLLGRIWSQALRRAPSLRSDLSYFSDGNSEGIGDCTEPVSDAAQRFADRLYQLANREPERLIGHVYTRYLGDLSGGQILRGLIVKALALRDEKGVSFYAFTDIPDPTHWKQRFRLQLDELALSEQQQQAVVDEALRSFVLSGELFSARDALLQMR